MFYQVVQIDCSAPGGKPHEPPTGVCGFVKMFLVCDFFAIHIGNKTFKMKQF